MKRFLISLLLLIPSLAMAQQAGQPTPASKRYVDDQNAALRLLAPQPSGSFSNRPYGNAIATGTLGSQLVTLDPAGYTTIYSGLLRGNTEPPFFHSTHKFCGFPSAARNATTGRIFYVWANSSSHNANDTVCAFTYSDDGGNTWATSTIIAIDQGAGAIDIRHENIYCIPAGPHKGRLLLTFFPDGSGVNSKIAHSDNNGATWSVARDCYDTNVAFGSYNLGNVPIQLADYSLLQAGYGRKSGSVYVATVIKSTDGGITWTPLSTVLDGTAATEQPEEPALLLMDNGNILIAIREDATDTIRTLVSDDNGATWDSIASTAASFAVPGEGKCILHQFDSGTVVLSTRAAVGQSYTSAQEQIYYVSHDRGVTWSLPQKVDPVTAYYGVYGAFVEVAPNIAGFAYGVQHPTTSARGEVRWTHLIEGSGRTPLGGYVADKIRTGTLRAGRLGPGTFVTPPNRATATAAQVLDYVHAVGFPRSPLSVTGITGVWEMDTVPSTVNDLTANYASATTMARLDGSTVSGAATSGGTWAVNTGKLQNNPVDGTALNNRFLYDVGKSTGTVSADFTYQSSQLWMFLNYVDANNHALVAIDNGNPKIYTKVASGDDTTALSLRQTGTSGSFSTGVEKNLSVTLNGSTIAVSVGGTVVATHPLNAAQIAAFGSGTKFGFYTNDTTARFDNFVFAPGLATGDTFGYVADPSANTLHLTQSASGDKPTYWANIYGLFNNKPCARFNGTQALVTTTYAQSQPNAVQGVFFFDAASGGSYDIWSGNNASSLKQSLNLATTGLLTMNGGTSGAVGAITPPQPVTYPGGPYVFTAYYNGASSFLRVNGRYIYRADSTHRPGGDAMNQFALGDVVGNASFYTPGVAVYAHGSPTVDELIQAESYWADKYNVPMAFEGQ